MPQDTLTIRVSPFLFLKRLVFIEFFFALTPTVVLLLIAPIFNIPSSYDALPLANSLSYNLVVTILVTILQIVVISATFASWYFTIYTVDRQHIYHRRWFSGGENIIANTPALTYIEIKQGRLAERFDYGTLLISSSDMAVIAQLRDVSTPRQQSRLIEALIVPDKAQPALPEPRPIGELLSDGENQFVEYKSSLMWDYRQQRVNKNLYVPVMKNIVAFLNTAGGDILIGVDDESGILGLEPDLKSMPKSNVDGFENVFNTAFNNMVGVEYRQFVDVTFPELEGLEICRVWVRPSTEPAYLQHKGSETFCIRAGNASQPLTVSKAARYIQTHFSGMS